LMRASFGTIGGRLPGLLALIFCHAVLVS